MSKNVLNFEIETPKDTQKLVELPYDQGVFLCPLTMTRWTKLSDGEYSRDLTGEDDWREMAAYVNTTYEQVFKEAYERARKV